MKLLSYKGFIKILKIVNKIVILLLIFKKMKVIYKIRKFRRKICLKERVKLYNKKS
jgi:hypothetical protein